MRLHRGYKIVAKLISDGDIKSFRDIFEDLPKTVVKTDMRMHHITFAKRLKHPESFTLKEMIHLASLIGVSHMTLIELIYKQYLSDQKLKPKK
jgi:hypothetical protein